jgi:hypothetical protein
VVAVTAIEWKHGMRARLVEHDPGTGQPLLGGAVYPAEVASTTGEFICVIVTAPDEDMAGLHYFYRGVSRTRDPARWRLLPADDEAATMAAGKEGQP